MWSAGLSSAKLPEKEMVLTERRTFQASRKQSSVWLSEKNVIPCPSGGKQGYKLTRNLYLLGDES